MTTDEAIERAILSALERRFAKDDKGPSKYGLARLIAAEKPFADVMGRALQRLKKRGLVTGEGGYWKLRRD